MASAPQLQALPIEILVRICECLRREHLASLLALSRSCKLCHSIANPLLFHDIHLSTATPDAFDHLIQDCSDLLRRNEAFRQVRRLFIDNNLPHRPDQKWEFLRKPAPGVPFGAETLPALEVLDIFSDENLSKSVHCILRKPVPNDFDTADDAYTSDADWQPLALLLEKITGLRELHFSCPNQFPPCLLQALERYQPRCKLFLNAFRLRSLSSPAPDPHELRLVTSPCLRRIRMACWYRKAVESNVSPPDDATVVRYLVGMAPNLEEVLLDHNYTRRFHRLHPTETMPSPSTLWVSRQVPRFKPASLRKLSLAGSTEEVLSESEIEQWKASTDFAALQLLALSFRKGITSTMLDSLTMGCNLSSLTTMVLSIGIEEPSHHQKVEHFLRGLPCLSALHLIYFGYHLPDLVRLGHGLRTLSVRGRTIVAREISQLGEDCPLLEELLVTLHRSHGDQAEVNRYRVLGECLPRLRRLAVSLDVPLPLEQEHRDDDHGLDGVGSEFYPGSRFQISHLRNWFVNSAMDEALARSIFDTISSARPRDSTPLESFKIQFLGGFAMSHNLPGLPRLEPILAELRSSWRLVRGIRDDGRDEITATRSFSRIRRFRYTPSEAQPLRGGSVAPELCAILERIWPSRGEAWPWKWESQPLQNGPPS